MRCVASIDTVRAENAILTVTNEERLRRGFAPLHAHTILARLARFHSNNMAGSMFFDHVDPQRRTPEARRRQICPNLIGGFGENLAIISVDEEETMARIAVRAWMKSPGHRRNILYPAFSHLGVGVALSSGRIYLTQSFSQLLLEFALGSPRRIRLKSSSIVQFRSWLPSPQCAVVWMSPPDPTAQCANGDGSYYTGAWPLPIRWRSAAQGEVTVSANFGPGTYSLFVGERGTNRCVDEAYTLQAI
jgi:hypothetical protein